MILLLNELTPQDKLETILDLRLSSAVNEVGNLSPLVAHLKPLLQEVKVLLERPLALVDRGVECCEPSFSTLLAVSLGEGYLLLFCIWCHLVHLTNVVE